MSDRDPISNDIEKNMAKMGFTRRDVVKTAAIGGTIGTVGVAPVAADNHIVRADDLIAHWPFEDGFNDVAGGHNAESADGDPQLSSFNGRDSVYFDGDDALRISRGGNEELNLMASNRGPVSFSFWFYPEESDNGTIYIHETGMNIRTIETESDNEVGIEFNVRDNPSWADGQEAYSMSETPKISLNQWHYIGVIADSTNFVRMYIDGNSVYSDNNMQGKNDHYSSFWVDITIGNWYGGNPEEWGTGTGALNGKVSDFRIYEGELSSSEISQIYQNTSQDQEDSDQIQDASGEIVATIEYTPSTPEVGERVAFDASSSETPNGEIVNYSWDFGDGNTASGETATHTFEESGGYTVELSVVDDEGQIATTTESLNIADNQSSISTPGFGITSTIASLGGAGYIIKRWFSGEKKNNM
ncbi:PKD domain-containing protein [Halopenitus malekzadehii]|uniref:PKD domain-containing protein n=1 Tax=Halopenitus malekzadehii TaxID=1267564 RepID=A0A1H6JGM6_9EURY|nr:PKD domain-containing protein [Halopenitus malekzadehii]SEH61433.1 PKD domain-containing protein [Halopenitus malekzadehii]